MLKYVHYLQKSPSSNNYFGKIKLGSLWKSFFVKARLQSF